MIVSEKNTATVKLDKPAAKKVLNILLVDDHPANLLSIESILADESRNIIKASSGNEALEIALNTDIAVMLLDVQMPEMDGFEVARLLKENSRTKNISILFITALSKDEKYTMQGYEEGAVDYLYKPLDINLVKAKVNVFEKLYRQRIELHESNEMLISTNKYLDEFVYIVSHDLKAPLRGLSSLCSFLEEELTDNVKPEVAELLDLIKGRTSRMQSLIEGILHYSRMAHTRTTVEQVDLKELIINIIDLISPPSNYTIETEDSLPVLSTERIKLHEVFQNLISNAVKYCDKEQGRIKIYHKAYPDHYEFTVEDNGCGIKSEHFEKVFAIFQTLSANEVLDNTGIGLTIVKRIVEQQGGKIWIESEYGSWTRFSFTWNR